MDQFGFTLIELSKLLSGLNQLELIRKLQAAVVKIELKNHPKGDKVGTGFFICENPPLIMMARHVLPTARTIENSIVQFNYTDENKNEEPEKLKLDSYSDYDFDHRSRCLQPMSWR